MVEKAENNSHKKYLRQMIIPEWGEKGQEKLRKASVLVIGAGGLGCPVLQYLVAAGVGNIGIVDEDVISESNLHRQVLYGHQDVGRPKVEIAKERLMSLNKDVQISTFKCRFTKENASELAKNYHIIADASDNFPTRYLVNDFCVLHDKINVFASVLRFEGQVTVFNYPDSDGNRGPNYRDIFPKSPDHLSIPNCAEAGVIGSLTGLIGSVQATEIIKIITGIGNVLSGKLWMINARTMKVSELAFNANEKFQKNNLMWIESDYEELCFVDGNDLLKDQEIDVETFKNWTVNNKDFLLVDVREEEEFQTDNIGGVNIPMSIFKNELNKLKTGKELVFICLSGKRSEDALQMYQGSGRKNAQHLKGGLIEYWESL